MSGDSVKVALPLFQEDRSGAVPTSPHQYKVRQINQITALKYIKENHYSRTSSPNPFPCYGLYWEDFLIGVLMFSVPVSENVRASVFGKGTEDTLLELHRLHIQDNTPKNTESWFIGKCLKFMKKTLPHIMAIISFADPSEGHEGTIYKATNFVYAGKSNSARFYRDKEGILRHPRQKTHKNGKRVSYNVNLEDAGKRGWTPEVREGKHRFIYYFEDKV